MTEISCLKWKIVYLNFLHLWYICWFNKYQKVANDLLSFLTGVLKEGRMSSSISSKSVEVFTAVCRSTRLCLLVVFTCFTYACVCPLLWWTSPTSDMTWGWWAGGAGPPFCFGHTEQFLEKHRSLSVDMEKSFQLSFYLKTKWKLWNKGMNLSLTL